MNVVRDKGEVDDDDMQAAVGDAINLTTWYEKWTGHPYACPDGMVLNRRRAVWVNHGSVVPAELERLRFNA